MTKAEIVENIYNSLGLTKKDINIVVDTVFEIMKENLFDKKPIKISGFGSFDVKKRGQRIGRNPKTGEEKVIEPRYVVVFKPSNLFKNELNGTKQ
jgi:integration host factor subunit alpha